jgi:hypothetical protein
MPAFTQRAGYGEIRRVLHPRWYAAARLGFARSSVPRTEKAYETAIGFRPNTRQLIKFGYQFAQAPKAQARATGSTFAIQLVTTFTPISIASD